MKSALIQIVHFTAFQTQVNGMGELFLVLLCNQKEASDCITLLLHNQSVIVQNFRVSKITTSLA